MQRSHFILLFFIGNFPLILSLPRKYFLIQQEKTWSEAQAYCRANHTDLATIENNDDVLQLKNVADIQQFTSEAWIGLYKVITSWHWSFENILLGNIRHWDSNNPYNYVGDEECALIHDKVWRDKPCAEKHSFVCCDEQKNGTRRYIYNSTQMTWHGAQSFCRQQYTDLASVRDQEEANIIYAVSSGDSWFGLSRHFWKWVDHTNVSSIPWKKDKPDKNGQKTCGFLLAGQAVNEDYTQKMSFFCYSEITGQKQIMRVKVQSKQEVNDPEVQAAILNKIKEKLKELGVAENTTVTWRKQLDGEVFHKEKEKNATAESSTFNSGEL